ncbi:hypothetical protein N2D48_11745 [Enterococcus faecium]|nr:hypothetical protein [Enterococcus faecium]HDA6128334.1 hypothetical protein [Enterococcus faecium]
MAKLIAEKGEVSLFYPFNEWDMNYHILDDENNKHYLIDIDDVGDDEEYCLLSFEELKELDMNLISDYSWKTTKITD